MDLMELNDIFCRDRTRIEKNNNFSDIVKVLYPFAPKEDAVFMTNPRPILDAVVIHPFVGAISKQFYHDLGEWMEEINRTPVSSSYGMVDTSIKDSMPITDEQYAENYEFQKGDYPCNHPDIGFSDMIPGITMAMSMVRNCNDSILEYDGLELTHPMRQYEISKDKTTDDRSLSLVYVKEDGSIRYGYGSILFFGAGLVPLPTELKMYLLSNTYLIGKNISDEYYDEYGNEKIYNSYDRMKTACIIVYEDSIRRLM